MITNHFRLAYNTQLGKWLAKDVRGNTISVYEHRWKSIPLVGQDIIVSNNVRVDIEKPVKPIEGIPRRTPEPEPPRFVDLVVNYTGGITLIGGSNATPWVEHSNVYFNCILYPDYSGGVKKTGDPGTTPCFAITKYYDPDSSGIQEQPVNGTDASWFHIGYQSFVNQNANNLDFGGPSLCTGGGSSQTISTGGSIAVLDITASPFPDSKQYPPPEEQGQPDLGLTPGDYLTIANRLGVGAPGLQVPPAVSVGLLTYSNSFYQTAILDTNTTLQAQYIFKQGTTTCGGGSSSSTTTSSEFTNVEPSFGNAGNIGEQASVANTSGNIAGGSVCTGNSAGVVCNSVPSISYQVMQSNWTRYTTYFFDLDPAPGPGNTTFTTATRTEIIEGAHYIDDFVTYGRLYNGVTYGTGIDTGANPFSSDMYVDWFAGDGIIVKKATTIRAATHPLAPVVESYRALGQDDISLEQAELLPRFGTRLGAVNSNEPEAEPDIVYDINNPISTLDRYENSDAILIHLNNIVKGKIIGGQFKVNSSSTYVQKPGRDFPSGIYSLCSGFWEYIFSAYDRKTFSQFYPDRGYIIIPADFEIDGKRLIRALVLKSNYTGEDFDFGVSYIRDNPKLAKDELSTIIGGTIRGEDIL